MSIFSSVEELLSECGKRKAPLWRLVMEYSAHESGIEPQRLDAAFVGRNVVPALRHA